MNYNYLFDLTPISYQEQLICSDWLEDREEENLAHCLKFNYKTINYSNSGKGKIQDEDYFPICRLIGNQSFVVHGKNYGFYSGRYRLLICRSGTGQGHGNNLQGHGNNLFRIDIGNWCDGISIGNGFGLSMDYMKGYYIS